jgi:hypothetical protein
MLTTLLLNLSLTLNDPCESNRQLFFSECDDITYQASGLEDESIEYCKWFVDEFCNPEFGPVASR